MSALSNVNWTFIDEHRSSSLIVKSSGDARGIRDRTYHHFSASLSTDRCCEPRTETLSPREAAVTTKNAIFNQSASLRIFIYQYAFRENTRACKRPGHFAQFCILRSPFSVCESLLCFFAFERNINFTFSRETRTNLRVFKYN